MANSGYKKESNWGEDTWSDDDAPVFNLMQKRDPKVEALRDEFVGMDAYLCWSKAERKLYSRLKAEQAAKKFLNSEKHERTDEEISKALANLSLLVTNDGPNKEICDVMAKLEQLRLSDGIKVQKN